MIRKKKSLDRIISKRGFCSRSVAQKLIAEGRVSYRGQIILDSEFLLPLDAEIFIDGEKIIDEKKCYFAFYKPRGCITSFKDEKGRETALDIFNKSYREIFKSELPRHIAPVGRLDAASEGLLLFTNDTEWANEILEPKKNHFKIYCVQIQGIPSKEELLKMENGFLVPPRIYGKNAEWMKAEKAEFHKISEKTCWLKITLTEGKNRQIRRMLKTLGYEVLRLIRVQIDNFTLGELKPSEIKILNLETQKNRKW